MKTFKEFNCILEVYNEDHENIRKIASEYRRTMENDYDETDDIPSCIQGECNYHAKKLSKILKDNGYNATPVLGKFKDIHDSFVPNHWDQKQNNKILAYKDRNGYFPPITHAWVNVIHNKNKYIVDTTADQFTKDKNDSVIVTKKDTRYTRPIITLDDET